MKYLRRVGLFMAFFTIVGAVVLSAGLTPKASAAGEKYEFKDASTIIGSSGDYSGDVTFKKQSNGKFEGRDGICGRGICSKPLLTLDNFTKNPENRGYSARLSETDKGNTTVVGRVTVSDPRAVGPNGGASAPINSNGSAEDEPSCEDNGGPLAWFLCPVTSTLDGIIGFLDGQIQERLLIDDAKYNNDAIRDVWAVMRNVAFLILVPIMLVMVIGTALDFGPFDAYTVKKALPRMFAAVIFIALSLPICQFFINLANIAGTGVLGLMTAPFESNQITLQSLYDSGGDLGLLALGAGGLFLGIAAGGVTIGIVMSYAFVFMVALLIAYLVLLLRELVILFLIIIAPLAILVWIFPANDKPWKLWRGAFINLLIMFPLIMALIAAGRIMAEVIDTTQGNTAALFLKLTAYILPYFFIPATFKVAGGLFATVAGIANDRSRGVFDRQRKLRQVSREGARERAKSGNRFKGGTASNFRGKLNRGIETAAFIPHAGADPRFMRSRMQAAMSRNSLDEAQEALEKNDAFRPIKNNDDFLNAGLHGKGDDSKTREYLKNLTYQDANGNQVRVYSDQAVEQGVAAIRAARRELSPEVFDTAAALALPATGTAFRGGAGEMHELINEVAGSDRVKAGQMLAAMRSGAGSARRFDLAGGGFGHQIGVLEQQFNNKVTVEQANQEIFKASLEGQGGQYIAAARPGAVKNFAPVIRQNLEAVYRSGDDADFKRELAIIAGRYDAMAAVAPENARVLSKEVLSVTLPGRTDTVQEMIEASRSDPAFTSMRREYGSVSGRAAAEQAARGGNPEGPVGPVIPPAMPGPQQ